MEERYYDEYSRIQDEHWWFVGRRRVLTAVIARQLAGAGPRQPFKTLDVGCGTGSNLGMLSRFGEVRGVDPAAAAVAECVRRGWDVSVAEGEALPFADDSFGLVTLLDVIEHAPDDGPLLREARRVCRPDGLIVVTVPAYQWMWGPHDEISHHMRRYTKRTLDLSLERSGLRRQRATYFNTLLMPPIAAVRLLSRLLPEREARSDFDRPVGRLGGIANRLLATIFGAEAHIVPAVSLPFGVSVLVVARP
ncbi:MAG: methyltransferase domain-containing protein [Solirubrobacterales bacterium]|nr:methyltransferase domain-containing protein [Solirubrobacterales bacterium]